MISDLRSNQDVIFGGSLDAAFAQVVGPAIIEKLQKLGKNN